MRTFRFSLHRLMVAVVLLAIFFLSLHTVVDPDYFWHIANGRHFWDGVLFGGRDVYSWTAAGALWVEPEWLPELVMSVMHDTFGPTANSILAAAIVALSFGIVALRLRKRGFGWTVVLLTVWLSFTGSLTAVGVRIQMLELLYSAATLMLVDAWLARPVARRRSLFVWTALGAILWANTHGSFPLLPVFLTLTSVGLFLDRNARWRPMAIAVLVALIAVLANPWGWNIYGYTTQSITSPTTQMLIQEWRRPALRSFSFIPLDIELVLIGLALVLWSRARFRGRVRDVLIALAVSYLALQSARHVMLLGICAALLIASSLEFITAPIGERLWRGNRLAGVVQDNSDDRARDLINVSALVAIAVALALISWRTISPAAQERAVAKRYPVRLLEQPQVRSALSGPLCLFNEYTWGGFLIERGYLPVFIDGRGEVYGVPQMERYGSIIHLEPGWNRLLDSLRVDAALMPVGADLTAALQRSGWVEIGRDSAGVLLSRSTKQKKIGGCMARNG